VCEVVKLPCLFGTVVVLFWKLLSILCLLLCAIVCEFTLRNLVFRLCLCYLRLFGAVSSLLCGIEAQRADCVTNCRSRVCQRISIGWS